MLPASTADRLKSVQESRTPNRLPLAEWNRRIGWMTICLGAASGLILGLWSFDGPFPVPTWLGSYDQTGRRLARLGHIAFFGLGILNVLVSRELRQWSLGVRSRRIASWSMNFGNVFLALTLFAAAAYRPFKYGMSVPAVAVFLALLLTAISVWCDKTDAENGQPHHDPTA